MMFCHWTISDSVIIYIASIQMSFYTKDITDNQKYASYRDLHFEIDNGGRIKTNAMTSLFQ